MDSNAPNLSSIESQSRTFLTTTFAFCYIWAIGGNIIESNLEFFDAHARQLFEDFNDCKVITWLTISITLMLLLPRVLKACTLNLILKQYSLFLC